MKLSFDGHGINLDGERVLTLTREGKQNYLHVLLAKYICWLFNFIFHGFGMTDDMIINKMEEFVSRSKD